MDAKQSAMGSPTLDKGHFDANNPLSLYSKMGLTWAKKFMDKLGEVPECADMLTDETVLAEHLKKQYKFRPTGSDHRFRLQLWLEYENSIKHDRPMQMSYVYSLAGPESTFHVVVMKSAPRVAWMLCRPVSYEAQTREILATGLLRLRGYLDKDPFPEGQKPDHKLARLQLDIVKMMDLRQHGAPTQKIQSLELKGTIGANGEIQAIAEKLDMKALEERKKKLEDRKRKAEGRAAAEARIVDVEIVKEGEDEGEGKDSRGSVPGECGEDSGSSEEDV
jgi:hypothetical protein